MVEILKGQGNGLIIASGLSGGAAVCESLWQIVAVAHLGVFYVDMNTNLSDNMTRFIATVGSTWRTGIGPSVGCERVRATIYIKEPALLFAPLVRFARRHLLLLIVLAVALTVAKVAPVALAQAGGGETLGDKPTLWLHKDISTYGHEIDFLFDIILWMTLIVGVLVFIVLGIFLVQYRYKPERTARYIHGNAKLEIVWTLVPALLMALTAAISQSTWAKIKNPSDWPETQLAMEEEIKSGKAILVEVTAQQFNWTFRYPGKDMKFGQRKIELIKKGTLEEGIGLDRSDPSGEGKDDIVTGALVVPVNTKIYINLVSVDVLHSFFLPNFRVKQDAVPGLRGKVWFQATQTSGEVIGRVSSNDATRDQERYFALAKPFDIVCAELCGGQHYAMKGPLYVVTREQFDRYMTAQQEAIKAASGGGEDY